MLMRSIRNRTPRREGTQVCACWRGDLFCLCVCMCVYAGVCKNACSTDSRVLSLLLWRDVKGATLWSWWQRFRWWCRTLMMVKARLSQRHLWLRDKRHRVLRSDTAPCGEVSKGHVRGTVRVYYPFYPIRLKLLSDKISRIPHKMHMRLCARSWGICRTCCSCYMCCYIHSHLQDFATTRECISWHGNVTCKNVLQMRQY